MNMRPFPFGPGIEINGRIAPEYAQILTPEAVAFAARLQRAFGDVATSCSRGVSRVRPRSTQASCPTSCRKPARSARRLELRPDPADILDRRVEITGPVDRKMVINALNSGAKVFMADFEDANTPSWDNIVQGQLNLRDAIRRGSTHVCPKASRTGSTRRRPCCSCGRAAGTCRRSTCCIDGAADLRRHLRLRALLLPQREGAARAGHAARTSTCRSSRATSRRGSGTTSSSWRRTSSASRRDRSRRPC